MQIQKLECQNLWIHHRGEHGRERQRLSQLLTVSAETAEAKEANPGADTFIGDREQPVAGVINGSYSYPTDQPQSSGPTRHQ